MEYKNKHVLSTSTGELDILNVDGTKRRCRER